MNLSFLQQRHALRLAWVIALLGIVVLVLAACIQPTPPAGSAAAANQAAAAPAAPAAAAGDPDAGAYIATLAGCGCHFNSDLGGMAGGNKFEGEYGVLYAPNVTSDKETGIGNWSAEQIATAITTGAEPDGEQLHAVMPYAKLSNLSKQEALDMAAWLLSLEPIANAVPDRELKEDPAAFTAAHEMADAPSTDPVVRGQQLVILTNCGGCHTPKNEDGTAKADMMLAGGPVRDEIAANITPDEATGIGSWTEEEIASFLMTGTEPDGAQVEGAMAQQIERRFSKLTEDDAAAIAAFLKSIPAVSNDPSAK